MSRFQRSRGRHQLALPCGSFFRSQANTFQCTLAYLQTDRASLATRSCHGVPAEDGLVHRQTSFYQWDAPLDKSCPGKHDERFGVLIIIPELGYPISYSQVVHVEHHQQARSPRTKDHSVQDSSSRQALSTPHTVLTGRSSFIYNRVWSWSCIAGKKQPMCL